MQSQTYIMISFFAIFSITYLEIDAYASVPRDIYEKRAEILKEEERLSVGGNVSLDHKETIVNDCLMRYKFKELDDGFANPDNYNLSKHFFYYRDSINTSKVYKIIKDMPKGAALHIHDMGILGPDYLVNITYEPNLYICVCEGRLMQLHFADSLGNLPKTCWTKWEKVSDVRGKNVTQFDAFLRKQFTLCVDDPDMIYPSIEESWKAFANYFGTVAPMLTYRPVWEKYFYDALKLFREHNIMYIEIRSILPELYELDGTKFNQLITAKTYHKVIRRFKKDFPDFFGAKLIFAPNRRVNREKLDKYIELAREIKKNIPESFAGFDIVGQEDLGYPLILFADQLKSVKDLNYFFHAGETNWYGTTSDVNILDAILLETKRLGHGYALTKHPILMNLVKERDIAIEVNLISNIVLSLVKDIRNHPLSEFLANGLPVVLSSDDPGAWEADPTEDWYVAFLGPASRLSDLRLLKTLALNSLKYSAMEEVEKKAAFERFESQWKLFVDNFQCDSY